MLGIKECLLYGTYDAFPKCRETTPKKGLTPTEIAIIVTSCIGFVVFTCCLFCVIVVLVRKKRKSKPIVQPLSNDSPERSKNYLLTSAESHVSPQETLELLQMKPHLAPYKTESEDEKTPEATPKHLLMGNVEDPSSSVDKMVLERGYGQEVETDF